MNPWKKLLYATDGPLTSKLKRAKGPQGLGQLPQEKIPDHTVTSVCGFCATGCGLNIHLKEGLAVNLSAATQYPVNIGMACPKGWEALAPLDAPDRGTIPLLRKNEKLEATPWETAAQEFTRRFKDIIANHGPDSIAFLSTGQIPTEEMAFLGAFFKFGMGGLHGDGNTRQCMATAATAYKQSFGFDAPPYSYQDLEESDLLILVGSNMCIAHPIMWERVMRNQRNPEIVVVDPRKTETAMAATTHLAIQPKGDLCFLYLLAKYLISIDGINTDFIEKHTTGFHEFSAFLNTELNTQEALDKCGISHAEISRLAHKIATGIRTSFWWTMGVNQSHEGVRTAQAIINICLMTGNIGKPGTGPNSITGQCNAMGSRLFSNTTSLLGGHDFKNIEHRQRVAEILNIPMHTIPSSDSLAYDQIIHGIQSGTIKGLWIIATNTAHSWMDKNNLEQILDKLDFLVVQDMYHSTETAKKAHLYLPAAGWGEKEGTFINSERRIGHIQKVRRSPGQALSDFYIFRLLSEAWGCSHLFSRWKEPRDVFTDMQRLSAGRPCDITGIAGYQELDKRGGMQWPVPQNTDDRSAIRRLFCDGNFFHADGKAKFLFNASQNPQEPPDDQYPFILLSGRGSSSQWHTLTRSAKSKVLAKLSPQRSYVEIHPEDASHLQIKNGMLVLVETRRGTARVYALVTANIGKGQLFMPMHFSEINYLTLTSVDPHSRQPSYKHCAARIQAA